MTPVAFTVMGPPKGKGRPEFRRQGRGVVTYTPASTVVYEKEVMFAASIAMRGREPIDGPVCVSIVAYFEPAKSVSKATRAAMLSGEIRPSRIDIDNICKCILDGAQNIVFGNDKEVVSLAAVKLYGAKPRVEVRVWPLDPNEPVAAEITEAIAA